jgi:DNA helicase-2/ATP-dependent DNA helicase PcrA
MQLKAVLSIDGPLLILAGAGSGKTSVLVNRAAHILRFGNSYKSSFVPNELTDKDIELMKQYVISGGKNPARFEFQFNDSKIYPSNVMAITFTNKAAKEMRERLMKLVGEYASEMWISTFHAACVRILRRDIEKLGFSRDFVIYDDADQDSLLKECIKDLNLDDKMFNYKEAKSRISRLKDRMIAPSEQVKVSTGNFREEKFASIYKLYEEKLKKNNALDFDNIINKTLELLELSPELASYYSNKFRYIMVDEYQDTNYPQYRLIKLFAAKHNNVCVVGDDDQSIYGWRGADIRNILEFEKDFGCNNIIKLEQNYRSSQYILDAANHVIKNNSGRKAKTLWTQNFRGEKVFLHQSTTEHYEAEFICRQIKALTEDEGRKFNDFAVLYRTNAQSRVIEEALLRYGMRYKIYGGLRFYSRKEIKDIIAYMRLCLNPDDDISLKRIINTPKRGIGSTTVALLENAAKEDNSSIFKTMCEQKTKGILPSRVLSKIDEFSRMVLKLAALKDSLGILELINEILNTSGYKKELHEENTDEAKNRLENIDEFVSAAFEFETSNAEAGLFNFLENIALISDLDEDGAKEDSITLMTLHSAKGLEFPIVFLSGMEEGLFPISRASFSDNDMEEERRLCYVGITRAKQKLYISYAKQRTIHGETAIKFPSRFVGEIPRSLIQNTGEVRNYSGFEAYSSNAPVRKMQTEEKRDFGAGDRIIHDKFGEGTIVSVVGSTNDTRIKIAFDHGGIKEFVAAIAPIKALKS